MHPVNDTVSKTGSDVHTTMNDTVDVIEVSESLETSMCHLGNYFDIDGAYLFVNPIKGTLVHELHTDAYVRIG